MITTNGIHIAVARLACSFLFLKNATPQVSVTHWRQATLSAASNEASGALSANTNLSRRRIATNSEIWFIISFISSPTQCTNRVLRTGVNSGPACEAERKGALSPRNRGAVKKRKMQVTNTNDVKTASPGLKRGVIFGLGNWPSSPSSPPHFAAFLAAAASTNVFNSGFGLPSYPVARIQVSMSCNFG